MIGLLLHLLARLPDPVLRGLARLLGDAWFFLVRVRRAVALDNLARSSLDPGPEAREPLVRRSCRHLILNMLELPRWCGADPRSPLHSVYVDGEHFLREAAAAGRGVLVVSAHLGNWELLGPVARRLGQPVALVVRSPAGPLSRRVLEAVRRRSGVQVIEEGPGALRAVRAALRDGAVVGFAVDQRPALGVGGVSAPFLGRAARIHRTPASLALRTGAPLMVALTHRAGAGHRVWIQPPLSAAAAPREGIEEQVRALTLAYSGQIEHAIAEHPDQWLWHHRRWGKDPAPETLPAPAVAALDAGGAR